MKKEKFRMKRLLNSRSGRMLCAASCILISLLPVSCATTNREPQKFSGATPLEWSQRLANSQMARHKSTAKWDYTVGLFSLSLLKLDV